MAAAVVLSAASTWTAQRRDMYTHLTKALNGDNHSLKRLSRGLMGVGHQGLDLHDMRVEATTNSNDAAGSSNIALDLSAQGLTVAAGALATNERRDIIIEAIVTNTEADPDTWFHWLQRTTIGNVAGELVIIGQNPQFLTDCRARVSCTTDGTTTSVEVAGECVAPAWWKGAAPLSGAITTGVATISWLGANAPCGSLVPTSGNIAPTSPSNTTNRFVTQTAVSVANSTTSISFTDGATPTVEIDAGAFSAECVITPPVAATLSVNATPTPDTLILSLVGISSIDCRWSVGVSIGDAYVIS